MNKNVISLLQQYGLTVTGNTAYGIMQGYETSLRSPSPMEQSAYYIHVNFYATDEKKQEIAAELGRTGIKLTATPSAYGLTICFPAAFAERKRAVSVTE